MDQFSNWDGYKTTDVGFAAALKVLGHRIELVPNPEDNRQYFFTFPLLKKVEGDDFFHQYANRELAVDAMGINEETKMLLTLLSQAKRN